MDGLPSIRSVIIAATRARVSSSVPPNASPIQVADLAAHYLVFDARERQALLEELDIAARVRRTAQALALQTAAIRSHRKISELN